MCGRSMLGWTLARPEGMTAGYTALKQQHAASGDLLPRHTYHTQHTTQAVQVARAVPVEALHLSPAVAATAATASRAFFSLLFPGVAMFCPFSFSMPPRHSPCLVGYVTRLSLSLLLLLDTWCTGETPRCPPPEEHSLADKLCPRSNYQAQAQIDECYMQVGAGGGGGVGGAADQWVSVGVVAGAWAVAGSAAALSRPVDQHLHQSWCVCVLHAACPPAKP